MNLTDFVRLYPFRASNISWLFGAGTSVSAGLPSAYDLIWDFKRRIYCAEQSYPLHLFNNLSDAGIRNQIQSYFNGKGNYPHEDSPTEYAWYFESAFPSAKTRREYIEQMMAGMQITYGHKVVGTLMKHKFINIIFTTNFDRAYENTAIEQFKNTDSWFYADLDKADTGLQLFQAGKFPLIIKLHGDYSSERLKNTSEELQKQDERLRHILTVSSYTRGLGIMGYSGRDESVMDALFSAINQGNSFPHGIFWFIKSGTQPLPIVSQFLEKAKERGIETGLTEIETFDTAWAEIIKGFDKLPQEDLDKLNRNYFRITNRPLPEKGRRMPLIRLNALLIEEFPTITRLYKCDAGNTKEIKDIIQSNKGQIIAIRKREGIIGFGADEEFQRIFQQYGEHEKDLYQIPDRSLYYDNSSIKGLLTDALVKALTNKTQLLNIERHRTRILIPDPKKVHMSAFDDIKQELGGKINGIIPHTKVQWTISLELCIQYKLQSAFLVLNPSVLASKHPSDADKGYIAPFIKEFTARWYNDKYDQLLTQWLNILFENQKEIICNAFSPMAEGVNATFKLNKTTIYTRLI